MYFKNFKIKLSINQHLVKNTYKIFKQKCFYNQMHCFNKLNNVFIFKV